MRGRTFVVDDLPCPSCGNKGGIVGLILSNEKGEHMHTKYACSFWPSGVAGPCGWNGWFVPGWDADEGAT